MTTQTNQNQEHIDLTNHPQAEEFRKISTKFLKEQEIFWKSEIGFKSVPAIAITVLKSNIKKALIDACKQNEHDNEMLHMKYLGEVEARDCELKKQNYEYEQYKSSQYKTLSDFLKTNKFVYVKGYDVLLDSETFLLWYIPTEKQGSSYYAKDAYNIAKQYKTLIKNKDWTVPTYDEVKTFAMKNGNPFRYDSSNFYYLCWNNRNNYSNYFCVAEGRILLNYNPPRLENNNNGYLIFCNTILSDLKTIDERYEFLVKNNWVLITKDNRYEFKATALKPAPFIPEPVEQPAQPVNLDNIQIDVKDIKAAFQFNDSLRCNLDIIKNEEFTYPTRGVWELYGIDENILKQARVFARNPEDDIQSGVIGIDFGTSSTVVARDNNGKTELLRVGTSDFNASSKANDYENPTVLEFKNYNEMISAWKSQERMPFVKWKDVTCSHAARKDLRNANTNPEIVSAIFPTLKQWVLKNDKSAILRMRDRNEKDFEILPIDINDEHLKFNAENKTLNVNNDYPFDPIELYAWFLGLNINRRGQGIFLRYNLSFPVAYPKAAREHIRSAFERGLYRSLPVTLNNEIIKNEFCVQVRATEPAAYVVGAYQSLNITPSDEGCYYGVFDFGGGTIDFDFGIIRNPNEEESEIYELVIEHFGEGDGDRHLGGENLIEHLAYETFKLNETICREKNISFTMPVGAEKLAASENLIKTSGTAVTNTLIVASKLRCIFEQGKLLNANDEEVTELNNLPLLNNDGEKVENINFQVDVNALIELLKQRIFGGCKNFLTAMYQAFYSISNDNNFPREIHILLAGNASRSNIVKDLFGIGGKKGSEFLTPQEINAVTDFMKRVSQMDVKAEFNNKKLRESCNFSEALAAEAVQIFSDNLPTFIVHSPLPPDDKNPYQPTAKTAVAIGLLALDQGSEIKIINHSLQNNNNESPFDFYVGKVVHNKNFVTILQHKSEYQKWSLLGTVIENSVNNLYYTQSAKALSGEMLKGDPLLKKYKLIRFDEQYEKQKSFIRAISPNKIEICAAESLEEIEKNNHSAIQVLEFKGN